MLEADLVPRAMVDNQSAIRTVSNDMVSLAATHTAHRYHFIKDKTSKGCVNVQWCVSKDELADIVTKRLVRQTFEELRCRFVVIEKILHTGHVIIKYTALTCTRGISHGNPLWVV